MPASTSCQIGSTSGRAENWMRAVPRRPSTAASRTLPSTSRTADWRWASSTEAPSRRDKSTALGSRLRRSTYSPAMSRRRTGAPVDQITSTVLASRSAVAGARSARRVRSSSVSDIGGLLARRATVGEVEAERGGALLIGSDLGIDLLGVVAALGDRLGAAFQARLDGEDFRLDVLLGVDVVEL